ncbi:MAG: hypothetical protein AABZ02_03040 [Bacteroidota bacterium]
MKIAATHRLLALLPGFASALQRRNFHNWLTSTKPLKTVDFSAAQVLAERERFEREVSDPGALVSVTDFIPPNGIPRKALCTFGTLVLPEIVEPLELVGLKIRRLRTRYRLRLVLKECFIDVFEISGPVDIYADNSCIRRIEFASHPTQGSVGRFQWTGGFLGHLQWNAGATPFRGDVSLSTIALPRQPTKDGIQWLRDMRAILLDKGNQRAASFFHAAELAQERGREPLINRIVSRAYELGSDFGNSIGRPVLWLAILFGLVATLALVTGTEANTAVAIGWRSELAHDTALSKALRAGAYAMQSIFNPLNLFDSRPLVTVQSWFAAIVCGGLGILGTAAFALFVLSLRRRFRLE